MLVDLRLGLGACSLEDLLHRLRLGEELVGQKQPLWSKIGHVNQGFAADKDQAASRADDEIFTRYASE